MKKILILLLVMIVMAPAGMAQEKQKKAKTKKNLPSPLVEVWGGMGLSSITGNIASSKFRLTGLFGAGFTMPLTQQNHLHFEGAYSFQGFNYKPTSFQVDDDTSVYLEESDQRMNYFILTVQDKYFIDKKRTYYVNGGFYLSYLSHARFQANYELKVEGQPDEHREIDDGNKDDFTGVDFGLTAGVGVRLGNKALSNFTIEARMTYGLVNIAKESPASNDPSARNIYGVLKLGIDIPVRN
ncbi:MAG: hypothetical protein DRJ15_12025 [Bacteroidetes bacterium]|nr:MAG: hypothetical protein DRJ15_12025 [Bacteroidota bacterium]